MIEEKLIQCRELMPTIGEILNKGCHVRLTVTGNSMFPFLRPGADSVELIQPSGLMHKGEIVLILKKTNQYVLHRIVSMNPDGFLIAGDAQDITEGPFTTDQVIALVNGIWRRDHYVPKSNRLWHFLSQVWIILLPLRQYLLIMIRRLYALKRKWF